MFSGSSALRLSWQLSGDIEQSRCARNAHFLGMTHSRGARFPRSKPAFSRKPPCPVTSGAAFLQAGYPRHTDWLRGWCRRGWNRLKGCPSGRWLMTSCPSASSARRTVPACAESLSMSKMRRGSGENHDVLPYSCKCRFLWRSANGLTGSMQPEPDSEKSGMCRSISDHGCLASSSATSGRSF